MTAEVIAFQPRPAKASARPARRRNAPRPAPPKLSDRWHEEEVTALLVRLSARMSELARLEPEGWASHVGHVAGVVSATHHHRRRPLIFEVPLFPAVPDDPDDAPAA